MKPFASILVVASLALFPARASDLPRADYEVVLFPVLTYGEIPGANNSIWTSSLIIYNGSEKELLLPPGCLGVQCPPVRIPPRTASRPDIFRSTQGVLPGVLVPIPRVLAGQIGFELRIQDVSRQALTWGTEIPVVRESETRRRVFLLDIPLEERFRQTLRIYDPLPHEHCVEVDIRYFEIESGRTVLEERKLLRRGSNCTQTVGSTFPHSLEIHDLASRFPGLSGTIGIEISTVLPDDRIWAFVSVTNNETQHVTIVTPQ